MDARSPELVSNFEARFGQPPTGLFRAPGRVNLIGEHTDYNGGYVLPFAIDRSALAAIRPRPDRRVRVMTSLRPGVVDSDLDAAGRERLKSWADYPLGVVRALRDLAPTGSQRGFDLALTSDVPVGAGLSSSAAIESTVCLALTNLWGLDLDRMTMARVGQLAENVVVGAPTGIMDQAASLLGEPGAALFLDCDTLAHEVVPLGFEAADLTVLVIDTRVDHSHADGGYGQRRRQCEEAAATLGVPNLRAVHPDDLAAARGRLPEVLFRRVRHVVEENQRVLSTVSALHRGDVDALGLLMDASHRSMRDDFEISTAELDLAVEATRRAGSLGARMTGGGYGGSAIAVLPSARCEAAEDAVREAFSEAGFRAPAIFVVRPSGGAQQVAA